MDLLTAVNEVLEATHGVVCVNAEHDARLTAARDKLLKAAVHAETQAKRDRIAEIERRIEAAQNHWSMKVQ